MRKIMLLCLVVMFSLGGLGCATLVDVGKDACDAALGGSKLGKLCDELDKLREDEEVVEEAIVEEVAVVEEAAADEATE